MKLCLVFLALTTICGLALAAERTQSFDTDPNWESSNNRMPPGKTREVTQDFGYSATDFTGKHGGEMGGLVTRASEPAYYADKIEKRTLDDKLSASGTFALTKTSGGGGIFFGFFRGEQPGSTGRPISSLGMDLGCENNGGRLAVRLITGNNQSCGTFITPFIPGKFRPTSIRNDGTRYDWKLDYDPAGAGGKGQFTFTLHSDSHKPGEFSDSDISEPFKQEARKRFPDTTTFTVDLPEGFKQQPTTFDHFGLMNATKPGGSMKIYFGDLHYLDQAQNFSKDPHWDASGNRKTYQTSEVAGSQNFGFSDTNFAGGAKAGEMGGTMWRTEGPVASYADRVGPLTLDDHLIARGKLAFPVGSPDSGMLLGWFNSKTVDQKDGLKDFLGVRVEGPTRVGHYFAPVVAGNDGSGSKIAKAPVLVPDKKPHDWSIEYDPKANGGNGAVVVHLDDESATLNLDPRKHLNANFDRFGIFTPRVGGSQVKIYFDDLTYTADGKPPGHVADLPVKQ